MSDHVFQVTQNRFHSPLRRHSPRWLLLVLTSSVSLRRRRRPRRRRRH